MQYFVLPLFLVIFSNILGKSIERRFFKKDILIFPTVVGFSTILALTYVAYFPIIFFKMNFKILLFVTLILFVSMGFFICKNLDLEKGKNKYNIVMNIIVIILVIIQILFALRSTIGSLRFYDTINYTNLITGNIYSDALNTIDFMNGYPGEQNGYAYQSFYMLASCLYYIMSGILSIFNIEFFYYTQHTWMYSVILYFLSAELIINMINIFKIKNKISCIFIILFVFIFMGNFFWNSEQAFLGNSFRMILTSYVLFFVCEYHNSKNNKYLLILIIMLYSLIATANSNATLVLIFSFAFFIIFNIDKSSLVFLFLNIFPAVINVSMQLIGNRSTNVMYPNYSMLIKICIFLIILYIAYKCISKNMYLINSKYFKYSLLVIVFLSLIIGSFIINGFKINFDAFINNWSGWNDMSWDYTDFSEYWRVVANIIYIIILFISFINYKSNISIKLAILIACCFFNPLASPIQNKFMPVFYRNYDISLNYYTIFFAISIFESTYYKSRINKIVFIVIAVLSALPAYKQFMYVQHDSFNIYDGYDSILRMTRNEADALLAAKDFYVNSPKEHLKVVSSIYQTKTELPKINTLYSRNNAMHKKASDSDIELYKILYRTDFEGDPYAPKNPDFNNICKYIKDSNVDMIIQDRRVNYYDPTNNTWYSLTYVIEKCGAYPIYTNDDFAIYTFNN